MCTDREEFIRLVADMSEDEIKVMHRRLMELRNTPTDQDKAHALYKLGASKGCGQ